MVIVLGLLFAQRLVIARRPPIVRGLLFARRLVIARRPPIALGLAGSF